jgi:SAM-dependent methyltransferase
MDNPIAEFYRNNPLMVSSPFGGVDGLNSELLEQVFAHLDIDLASRTVLDVGCGRGFMGNFVEAAGGTYTGVDFVPSRSGFRLALAQAQALPFGDGSFDAVFCLDAFEHFPDPDLAAAELRRVLRGDGFFFLSAPNYSNVAGLVKWVSEKTGRYAPNTWAPFRRWQPQEYESPLTGRRVRDLFQRAHFKTFRRMGHGAEVGLGLFPWVDHPKMPEAIQFRLQRFFNAIGPTVAGVCPASSLHSFWKMEIQ